MQNKIAVISEVVEYNLFKAIDASVFIVNSKEEAITKLKECSLLYNIVIISDTLAERILNQIKKYEDKPYPIVLSLPTSKGSLGVGLKRIVKKAKETLGIDIFKE